HDRGRDDERAIAGPAGSVAERPREGRAETAVGIEAGLEPGVERRSAAVERAHRRPEPLGALIGLERHPEPALEGPSDLHRIETACPQRVVAEADVRTRPDVGDERREPVRIARGAPERIAQPARTVAAIERVLNRRRELDVFGPGLARVAG